MQQEIIIFEKTGFPSIKLFDEHFEIKAVDYWEYKSFRYSEVKQILHYYSNNNWWRQLFINMLYTARIFAENDPKILEVKLKNGGDWTYKTSNSQNSQFSEILKLIRGRLH